ncbi:S100 calcium-binding protein, ventral prostate, isoform CRA_a [Rattus norvegicus]|uniref:S100 calcium-binding protein n=2 Tax=Rattus norvegicus TaxID=10116 RepID=F7FGS5_RAT|nr:S100 calcium-binding protein, ventral prostate [Rattus norvegicus]XP_038957954.1 S100 calcium-binding protein, ventral prostate isoform X1 [Rattus norvegicus]XP_038957955.1 S100 calcium-binding protein, ventral prostate isoform X1 [Rattus norvegicus]AAO40742.1 S100 calcium-binding protein [Rattus norvegicus]EDL87898.1 S100 calcium-binding protein, ventral prostate, isoform CRA_a [Rattus norvegicus]EDL87899.1 S100 calcium-binding protein, ventral prostate, isoform CRA_a [Rattus norvegicus]|eukprot:NP_788265.1 S100 calcium-binding protein, ventral prostate [Rattus norvegicus]
MAQNLTSTEQEIMELLMILQEFSVKKIDKLDVQEVKRLFREELPNFLKAMDEATKNKILNDKGKEMPFDEIWDMIGRMALEYRKKNSNALKD